MSGTLVCRENLVILVRDYRKPMSPTLASSGVRRPTPGHVATAFALFLASTAALSAQTPTPAPAKPDEETVKLEKFVTIGSRFNDRTVVDSPVPIDVLSSVDLQQNGYSELAQTLSVLVPSIDFPRPANTDGTDSIRPAAVR